jgi:hypothetical protein
MAHHPECTCLDGGCDQRAVLLTADTITDEQIRELLLGYLYNGTPTPDSYAVDVCDQALGRQSRYRQPDPACKPDAASIRRARARCAEILNARAKGAA